MTVWFTSDTHYGHARILSYTSRPFESVDEMDERMVELWNAVVKPGDSVYHLGDFALCDIDRALKVVKRLQGQKFLIFGNHDKRLRKDPRFLGHWIWARDLESIDVEGQKIVLCHYAMRVWNRSHHGSWQLFGHSHGTLRDDPALLQLDVGVDCWGYAPVSFETIREKMGQKKWEPVDQHGTRDFEK